MAEPTGITGVLVAAFEAVAEGLRLANTKSSRKYIDKIAEIRMEILKEEERGYEADDTRVERLYKELKIAMEAATQEIRMAAARSK